ncbi:hypothetical protein [Aeromicrobium sp. Root495]|nr:hypothetical protein [Aeromicrobium sp. Root495]
MRTKSITGGIAATIIGLALACATAYGVVSSQESAGNAPIKTSTVSYGS